MSDFAEISRGTDGRQRPRRRGPGQVGAAARGEPALPPRRMSLALFLPRGGSATGERAEGGTPRAATAPRPASRAEQDGLDASARRTRLGGPTPIGPPQGSPLDELAPGGVRESLPGRAGDRVPLARPPHRGTSAGAGA